MSPDDRSEHDADRDRPQLRIWDDERETSVGRLEDGGSEWEVLVLVEAVERDLVRGRISFRRGEERHDTAPILVDETPAGVIRRAGELPDAMLRQLLLSASAKSR